jgi:hypothetical protein
MRTLLAALALGMGRELYRLSSETLELAMAADAAAGQTRHSPYRRAVVELGFALLWHGDLDEATAALREGLTEA